jgi:hypothetical protein
LPAAVNGDEDGLGLGLVRPMRTAGKIGHLSFAGVMIVRAATLHTLVTIAKTVRDEKTEQQWTDGAEGVFFEERKTRYTIELSEFKDHTDIFPMFKSELGFPDFEEMFTEDWRGKGNEIRQETMEVNVSTCSVNMYSLYIMV